jgi:ABC-type Na+ efflux pump permease subunit
LFFLSFFLSFIFSFFLSLFFFSFSFFFMISGRERTIDIAVGGPSGEEDAESAAEAAAAAAGGDDDDDADEEEDETEDQVKFVLNHGVGVLVPKPAADDAYKEERDELVRLVAGDAASAKVDE